MIGDAHAARGRIGDIGRGERTVGGGVEQHFDAGRDALGRRHGRAVGSDHADDFGRMCLKTRIVLRIDDCQTAGEIDVQGGLGQFAHGHGDAGSVELFVLIAHELDVGLAVGRGVARSGGRWKQFDERDSSGAGDRQGGFGRRAHFKARPDETARARLKVAHVCGGLRGGFCLRRPLSGDLLARSAGQSQHDKTQCAIRSCCIIGSVAEKNFGVEFVAGIDARQSAHEIKIRGARQSVRAAARGPGVTAHVVQNFNPGGGELRALRVAGMLQELDVRLLQNRIDFDGLRLRWKQFGLQRRACGSARGQKRSRMQFDDIGPQLRFDGLHESLRGCAVEKMRAVKRCGIDRPAPCGPICERASRRVGEWASGRVGDWGDWGDWAICVADSQHKRQPDTQEQQNGQ